MFIKVNMMCDKLLVYCRMLIETQLETQLKTQLAPQLETQLAPQLETQLAPQLETRLAPQLETRLEFIVFATFFLSRRDGV